MSMLHMSHKYMTQCIMIKVAPCVCVQLLRYVDDGMQAYRDSLNIFLELCDHVLSDLM